jgi:hypothetical protein
MSHRPRQPKSNKDYVDDEGRGHVLGKHRGGVGASGDAKEVREGRDSRKAGKEAGALMDLDPL